MRNLWNAIWIDALIVVLAVCVCGAIAELAILWATTP